MNLHLRASLRLLNALLIAGMTTPTIVDDTSALPSTFIGRAGPDWHKPSAAEFVNVNFSADTWTRNNGVVRCTGQPLGVIRLQKILANLEVVTRSGGIYALSVTLGSSLGGTRRH